MAERDALFQLVELNWNLPNIKLLNTLQNFDNRQVHLIDSDNGKVVCKVFQGQFSDDQFKQLTSIFDYLANKKFKNAPNILKGKNGENFITNDNVRIIVMEYIEGETPETTSENYAKLGSIVGELNNYNDYPHPALISVDAIRPDFAELAKQLPERIRSEYLELSKQLPDIDSMPRSLIHFEASLGNTLQKADGTIVILDWDEAGTGATILDSGYHLITSFVSEDLQFDEHAARAFYFAYLQAHKLTEQELNHLFEASLFHALRYIIWGDTEKRWQRIQWSIENKSNLMSVIKSKI